LINFQASDADKKDIVEVTVTAKEASDKKLLGYLVKNKLLINEKDKRVVKFKYNNKNHPELNGQKVKLSFAATDGHVSIGKDLTLDFERTSTIAVYKGPKPTVYVSSISTTGLVKLRFSENMVFGESYLEQLNQSRNPDLKKKDLEV
jgi:hypothetical protein